VDCAPGPTSIHAVHSTGLAGGRRRQELRFPPFPAPLATRHSPFSGLASQSRRMASRHLPNLVEKFRFGIDCFFLLHEKWIPLKGFVLYVLQWKTAHQHVLLTPARISQWSPGSHVQSIARPDLRLAPVSVDYDLRATPSLHQI